MQKVTVHSCIHGRPRYHYHTGEWIDVYVRPVDLDQVLHVDIRNADGLVLEEIQYGESAWEFFRKQNFYTPENEVVDGDEV